MRTLLNRWCNRNHCTCWFDSLGKYDWTECCKQHDKDYASPVTRKYADEQLLRCLKLKAPKWMAYIMYYAVRKLGGWFR
jgi:hypothetical protein